MSHPYYDHDYIFLILEKEGLLSREQITKLTPKLSIPRRKGKDLVQWLDSLQLPRADSADTNLDEADIISLIARNRKWKFRRLDPLRLDMDIVTRTLPASFAKKRLVLPLSWEDGNLEIVCYDPEDRELQQDVERACQARTFISVAPRRDIERIISEFFDFKQSIAAAENVLKIPTADISNLEQYVRLAAPDLASSDKYIQKAVDHLFQYALDQRASDIHIEPKRTQSWIRLRIDGILHTIYRLPRVVHEPICTRIKTMSRLDIAEKRRPQDGRLKVAWKEDEAEVRISTIPVAFGEKLVLRLQSADILFSDLNKLGFSERDFQTYKQLIRNSHGIVLVTGPTGSGKSTTLYSTLRYLSSPDFNIVTVEDPIEMVCEEFNQIAVQPHIEVTFASILRNILRQDPDIVMIGEIRDSETARHAIQAALTGHLVFSTLHTNDAVSAITRLKDLGLDSYLIASTLIGIVAQRLVRMVCKSCGKPVTIQADQLRALGYQASEPAQAKKGTGCTCCRNTGYWGRIGIYEVLSASDKIKEMIHLEESEEAIKKQAFRDGMMALRHDALRKLLAGITTMEEVIGVTLS